MKRITLLLSLLLIASAAALRAAPTSYTPESGWYFSFTGDVLFAGDSNFSVNGTYDPNPGGDSATNGRADVEHETGFGLAAALGYHHKGFRYEFEYSYRYIDANSVGGRMEGLQRSNGQTSSKDLDQLIDGAQSYHALMFNILYDLYLTDDLYWYNGGGIGIGWVTTDIVSDETDISFVWQLRTGLGYRLTDWLDLNFGYRFFATTDVSFADTANGVLDGDDSLRMSGDFETPFIHMIEVGLRFNF